MVSSSENHTNDRYAKMVRNSMPLCPLKGKRIPICAFMYKNVLQIARFLPNGMIHETAVMKDGLGKFPA